MDGPISPPPVGGTAGNELPAYMSNGVVGLKVRDNPLSPGMALLNGFSGEHPERKIEAAALAPYPLAGDICLEGVWMSDTPQSVRIVDQAYDFSTAELTTRLNFKVGGRQAKIIVMSFCSREQPTVLCVHQFDQNREAIGAAHRQIVTDHRVLAFSPVLLETTQNALKLVPRGDSRTPRQAQRKVSASPAAVGRDSSR